MMIHLLIYVAILVFFFFVLIKATRMVLASLRTMIEATQVSAFGIASFLLAFSTSLPELLVGISAGLQQEGALALGTILGSNIANLSLVLGGAAMVAGAIKATDVFLNRDVFYVFLAGSFPLLLLIDGRLGRVDAVVLLVVYALYNSTVLRGQRKRMAKRELYEDPLWRRILVRFSQREVEHGLVRLMVGVALLIISADMIVRVGSLIGHSLGVPVLLIGLFVVAVGTSLPELVFEIVAIRDKEVAMAFGNILGSVVTNSTLILAVTAMISPIVLGEGLQTYLVGTVGFIMIFGLFWVFVWTKHELERWEGVALFGSYLLFAWIEIARAGMAA